MTKASQAKLFFVGAAECVWSALYLLYHRTIRVRVLRSEFSAESETLESNAIYIFWHSKTFLLVPRWRHCGMTILTLTDWKNLVYDKFCRRLGYQTVPATSPVRATVKLKMILDQGQHVVGLAVDGPKGPRGGIKKGAFYLSQKTKKPIIAAKVRAEKSIRIKSRWDHYEIPLPFTKAVIEMSEPIYPDGRDWTQMEDEIRKRLGEP